MHMKLTFIGADHEVTGSCHFLEAGGSKVLIDCGMEQGNNPYVNAELPVSYSEIDYIFSHTPILTTQACCRGFMPEALRAGSLPPMPRWIYARSCFATVPTSRRWRQNGKTGRLKEPDAAR